MYTLVLLRHGESEWNKENRFTGWTDVNLSDYGIQQAMSAGQLMKEKGYVFDLAYTSYLRRAIGTLWLALGEMNLEWIPEKKSWRLNERHYGALQGLNKAETAEKYGDDQVKLWRRGYAIQPPALEDGDERSPKNDPRYAEVPAGELPATESLADAVARVVPYWNDEIAPSIRGGKKILIAAHGNSLRALVKHLDEMSDDDVVELNIPTGEPLVYELDENLKPIRHYYLHSQEEIDAAIEKQNAMATSSHA